MFEIFFISVLWSSCLYDRCKEELSEHLMARRDRRPRSITRRKMPLKDRRVAEFPSRKKKKIKTFKWKKLAVRDGIELCAKDSVDFNWIVLLASCQELHVEITWPTLFSSSFPCVNIDKLLCVYLRDAKFQDDTSKDN